MEDSSLRLSLGVKNALDEEVPMFYDTANFSYDTRQHDPRGRTIFIGLKYSR